MGFNSGFKGLRTLLRKEDSKWKENIIQTSETQRTNGEKAQNFFADEFNSDVEENEDLVDDENFPCGFCKVDPACQNV